MKQVVFVDNYEALDFLEVELIDITGIKKNKLNEFGHYYLKIMNNYKLLNSYLNIAIKNVKELDSKKIFGLDLEMIFLVEFSEVLNKKNLFDDSTMYILKFISMIQNELNLYLYEKREDLERLNRLKSFYQKEIIEIQDILKGTDKQLQKKHFEYCLKILEDSGDFYTQEDYENDRNKTVGKIREEYKNKLNMTIKECDEIIKHIENLSNDRIKEKVINLLEKNLLIFEQNKQMIEIQNNLLEENYNSLFKNKKNNFLIYQGIFDYSLDLPKSKIYWAYEEEKGFYAYNKIKIDYIIEKRELNIKKVLNEINKKIETKESKKIISYNIENLKELLDVYLYYFITNNIPLKKCKNCGKYFIPHNKQVYCDNPSPQNPNKSCKLLSDDMRNNKSPVYELYRSNYKTQSSKKRRNMNNIPHIEKKFDKWNKLAKEKMRECEEGNITIEEYRKWLKESQDWIKNL